MIRHTDFREAPPEPIGMDRSGLVMAVGPVGAQQRRQRIRIISVAVRAIAERASTLRPEQPEILKAVKPSTW